MAKIDRFERHTHTHTHTHIASVALIVTRNPKPQTKFQHHIDSVVLTLIHSHFSFSSFLDRVAFRARMRLVIWPFLCHADDQAARQGTQVGCEGTTYLEGGVRAG